MALIRRDRQKRIFRALVALIAVIVLAAAGFAVAKSGVFQKLHRSGGDTASDGYAGEESNELYYQGNHYVYNEILSNYLFMGVDKNGDINEKVTPGDAGQTDALFLVSYNRKEQTVRGLAIPRDTMTGITTYGVAGDVLGEKIDHITLQYAYGTGGHSSAKLTAQAVSGLLNGVRIDGYTAFNMDVIPKLTEQIGTVTVTVPDDSLVYTDPSWTRGTEIVLDSTNTEKFVRSRDIEAEQTAMLRMERQKVFIRAFVQKLQAQQSADPHTVTGLYETLRDDLVTNMGNDIYVKLAGATVAEDMETLPGEAVGTDRYDEYHLDEQALYDMIIDMFYVESEDGDA